MTSYFHLVSKARAINLGNKNMKIGIFTGGTSVRSKNVFTDISRYPTGKHEINDDLFRTGTNSPPKRFFFFSQPCICCEHPCSDETPNTGKVKSIYAGYREYVYSAAYIKNI